MANFSFHLQLLHHGRNGKEVIQSYTGSNIEPGGYRTDDGTFVSYNRYPVNYTTWQQYYQDVYVIAEGENLNENEIVATFQQSSGPQVFNFPGYSIKWTATLQTQDQGVNNTNYVSDSGENAFE